MGETEKCPEEQPLYAHSTLLENATACAAAARLSPQLSVAKR